MEALTDSELAQINVRITDLLRLVQKHIKIQEGDRDRTWGAVMEAAAKDLNIIHKTELTLDDVYSILNALKLFDHTVKP